MSMPPWTAVAKATGLLQPDGTARPTIFAEMSALAVSTGAVNLGQGFPDDDGPESVKRIAMQAIADGVNQYPPGPGIAALRQAVADHQRRHYGLCFDTATEVLITTGATEAIAAAVLAFVQRGEAVATFEPFYDAYGAVIALAGATHVGLPLLRTEAGFRPDLDAFAAVAAEPQLRTVLLNSPHNPTGMVLTAAEVARIAEIAVANDLLVITDEVYEHLTFDGARHIPLATLPGMAERTLTISSVGKSFSFTGWKIGWVTGPAELVDGVRAVKQFLTYVSGAPFQPAVAAALDSEVGENGFVASLRDSLAVRRDRLVAALDQVGLPTVPTHGTYFVIADASQHLAALGFANADDFCRALPQLCGVVAVPVSAFTHRGCAADAAMSNLVRFTFTKSEATMAQAIERLHRLRH